MHYDKEREAKANREAINAVINYVTHDVKQVFEFGAKKHGQLNFTNANGGRCSHKEMHDSMFHHLAESFAGIRQDKDTGLDPLLHLASRVIMYYYRLKQGIVHDDDKPIVTKSKEGVCLCPPSTLVYAGETLDRSDK